MSMSHLDMKWTVAPFSTRRGTKEKNIAIVYRRFDSPPIYRRTRGTNIVTIS